MRRVNARVFGLTFMPLVWAVILLNSSIARADESICRDAGLTGKGFGLCTAYCEAMDCDGENPNANETACAKVQSKFLEVTGLAILPCGDGTGEPPAPDLTCPCAFDAEALRVLFLDSGTYPYQTCRIEKILYSLGASDFTALYFHDKPDPDSSPKVLTLGVSSSDDSTAGRLGGGFQCTAAERDETGFRNSPRPLGNVLLGHNYAGERLPEQESLYRACAGSLDAIVNEYFSDLECSSITTFDVQVATIPNPAVGCVPFTVEFEVSETFGGVPPFSSYLWDFGDGSTSTDISPAHTYNDATDPNDPLDFYIVEVSFLDVNGITGRGGTSVKPYPAGTPGLCP